MCVQFLLRLHFSLLSRQRLCDWGLRKLPCAQFIVGANFRVRKLPCALFSVLGSLCANFRVRNCPCSVISVNPNHTAFFETTMTPCPRCKGLYWRICTPYKVEGPNQIVPGAPDETVTLLSLHLESNVLNVNSNQWRIYGEGIPVFSPLNQNDLRHTYYI